MPPTENKAAVMKMVDAFNTGNTAIVDELVDAKHRDETPFPATTPNRDGLKQQIAALRTAFPDAKFSVDKITAEGATVAYRWTLHGTHKGKLFEHNPTNKKVTHHGNDFVTFQN